MLLGITIPLLLTAQRKSNRSSIGNYFGVTAEMGVTTFFGDLGEGSAQGDITNNLAYKIKANWNIKQIVDFSGRISVGKISGEKKRTSGGKVNYEYFNTDFVEYTLDLGVNLLAPLLRQNRDKFGIYATVGLGLIDFKVKLYDGTNDSLIQQYGYDGQQTTTELVIPIGGRAIYHISPSSAVSLQTTLSWVNTDKLDGKTGNDNSDFYNYLSVGYTYKINAGSGSSISRGKKGHRGGTRSPLRNRTRWR